jgi:hypothetical protein
MKAIEHLPFLFLNKDKNTGNELSSMQLDYANKFTTSTYMRMHSSETTATEKKRSARAIDNMHLKRANMSSGN